MIVAEAKVVGLLLLVEEGGIKKYTAHPLIQILAALLCDGHHQ